MKVNYHPSDKCYINKEEEENPKMQVRVCKIFSKKVKWKRKDAHAMLEAKTILKSD